MQVKSRDMKLSRRRRRLSLWRMTNLRPTRNLSALRDQASYDPVCCRMILWEDLLSSDRPKGSLSLLKPNLVSLPARSYPSLMEEGAEDLAAFFRIIKMTSVRTLTLHMTLRLTLIRPERLTLPHCVQRILRRRLEEAILLLEWSHCLLSDVQVPCWEVLLKNKWRKMSDQLFTRSLSVNP